MNYINQGSLFFYFRCNGRKCKKPFYSNFLYKMFDVWMKSIDVSRKDRIAKKGTPKFVSMGKVTIKLLALVSLVPSLWPKIYSWLVLCLWSDWDKNNASRFFSNLNDIVKRRRRSKKKLSMEKQDGSVTFYAPKGPWRTLATPAPLVPVTSAIEARFVCVVITCCSL